MHYLEQAASGQTDRRTRNFAVAPGVVTNNIDLIAEGRVKVRIAGMRGLEPWARLSSVGGGSERGFMWVPQVDDEVLVAFAQNDMRNAYVLGGLWSTMARPPMALPTDAKTKRIIKTGVAGGIGHEVEFDDLSQSITVTSSTGQSITITPLKIELANKVGTLSVSLDNSSQSVSITAARKIELSAPEITISGITVNITGTKVSVQAAGPCTMQGLPIKLN